VPKPRKPPTVEQALKRLRSLRARLPEESSADFDKAIAQLEAASSAAESERQTMAETISQHESSIAGLQEINTSQARLVSALTQPSGEPGGEAPIVIPRPFPTIFPSIAPTQFVPPSPAPSPAPSPSPGPGPSPAPSASPVAIATAFQQAFTELQTAPGTPGPAIRSMDVQLKGLVQVSSDGSQTTLTFPTPENPISGDVLSTVSLSLGAVPPLAPQSPTPQSPTPTTPPG
jgi:hypothetical protein